MSNQRVNVTTNNDKRVFLIAGPTASGKSALALMLAERTQGVIINADAMQLYADLRVLTARPSTEDEARAPHKLYGHVDGAHRYSVGKWLAEVERELSQAWEMGLPAIVVGGTGLYFKALEEGLSPVPDISNDVRTAVAAELETDGVIALHASLRQADEASARAIEPGDAQRIVRALEVMRETGTPLSEWNKKPVKSLLDGAEVSRGFAAPPRDELYERCNARFLQMIDNGAIGEVEELLERGLASDLPVMKAIGVREFSAYMKDELTLREAIEKAQMQTRRYAKRQMTWFRGQMAHWPSGVNLEMKGHFLQAAAT
ncbi:MAG: tRNA (adenosine(37)-N6)-dimethylallyltransferase MiaA [Hyphomicrobiales bacterium]